MKTIFKIVAITSGLVAAGLLIMDCDLPLGWGVGESQAVVGMPGTPLSVAGVARRTTRRVIRHSTIYVVALPMGCQNMVINGVPIYQCGQTYYQAYGNQYVVVYVD